MNTAIRNEKITSLGINVFRIIKPTKERIVQRIHLYIVCILTLTKEFFCDEDTYDNANEYPKQITSNSLTILVHSSASLILSKQVAQ
jgi:hypothetical protein